MADAEDTAPKRKKSFEELAEGVRQRAAKAQATAEQQAAENPRQMFLPGMDEFMRALPNSVADSSLFAPVARGVKKTHTGTLLASRLNASLTYWGVQLNELHADITMQLLWEQQRQGVALGEAVYFERKAFLRSLGWGGSGAEYKRFHRYMLELAGSMLVIESRKPDGSSKYQIGKTKTFRILESIECDDDGENYRYQLDPRWVVMFGNREYALIDWEKRMQIGAGQDLAKGVQRLLATSADSVQRFALAMLREKMQYSSPMRKFRDYLSAAMRELERLQIVARWEIGQSTKGKEQLTVWIPG
jgi:hypothetical protein